MDIYNELTNKAEREFNTLTQEFEQDIIGRSDRRRHSYYEVAIKQEILEFLQTREQDNEDDMKAFTFLNNETDQPLEYFFETYCSGEDETWAEFRNILWCYRDTYNNKGEYND